MTHAVVFTERLLTARGKTQAQDVRKVIRLLQLGGAPVFVISPRKNKDNTRQNLIKLDAVATLLPGIGYARQINALTNLIDEDVDVVLVADHEEDLLDIPAFVRIIRSEGDIATAYNTLFDVYILPRGGR